MYNIKSSESRTPRKLLEERIIISEITYFSAVFSSTAGNFGPQGSSCTVSITKQRIVSQNKRAIRKVSTLNNVKLLGSKSSRSWHEGKNTVRCWITTQDIREARFKTKINNMMFKWLPKCAPCWSPHSLSTCFAPSSVPSLMSVKDNSDCTWRNEGRGHTDSRTTFSTNSD